MDNATILQALEQLDVDNETTGLLMACPVLMRFKL